MQHVCAGQARVYDMKVGDWTVFFCGIILSVYIRLEEEVPMPDSLPQLEAQRTDLFRQLAAVGDFRRGSITTTSGKCGKPTCHCAKRDDPGHGPNFRLTRKVQGKTVTETFDSPAVLRKAQQEVVTFHRFQELCGKIVEVSEKICALRPVEETLTPEEKKRPRRSRGDRARSNHAAGPHLRRTPAAAAPIWRPSRGLCARPSIRPEQRP